MINERGLINFAKKLCVYCQYLNSAIGSQVFQRGLLAEYIRGWCVLDPCQAYLCSRGVHWSGSQPRLLRRSVSSAAVSLLVRRDHSGTANALLI